LLGFARFVAIKRISAFGIRPLQDRFPVTTRRQHSLLEGLALLVAGTLDLVVLGAGALRYSQR
jgi:hypothetical protein